MYIHTYIESNVPSGTKMCKMCITYYNIRNHCLVITQNGFVATQALGHMMYVMYSELLYCIKFCWQNCYMCIYRDYFRN